MKLLCVFCGGLIIGWILMSTLTFKADTEPCTAFTEVYIDYTNYHNAVEHIKQYEDLRLKPYTLGNHQYIGYGHQIKKNEKYLLNGISVMQADSLLHSDYMAAIKWVHNKLNLYGNQVLAVSLLVYNMGTTRVANSTLYDMIKFEQPLYDQWLKYNKFNGKPHKKLSERREYELKLFLLCN